MKLINDLIWKITGKVLAKELSTALADAYRAGYRTGKTNGQNELRDQIIVGLNNDAVITISMPIELLERVVTIVERENNG